MWRKTGLIGRDNLLKKAIMPRLQSKTGFTLQGGHGIGKTAIMEWSFEQAEGKKAFISATWTKKMIMQKLAEQWEIKIKNPSGDEVPVKKALTPWIEEELYHVSGAWLFIDDLHRVTPAMLQVLKPIRERCQIVGTIIPPIRKEELKRMLHGIPAIKVQSIKKTDMVRIAEISAPILGTSTPLHDAVHAACGRPAHLFHALLGEVTPETEKHSDEEIDIAPALIIFLGGLMVFRGIARGFDSSALSMLAGGGTGLIMIARYFLFRGFRK